MLKDGKDHEFTREEAISLFREMWNAIPADCVGGGRNIFKKRWLREHGYTDVECNCPLCGYANLSCDICPINWHAWDCMRGIPKDNYIISNSIDTEFWSDLPKSETIYRYGNPKKIANLPER